MAPSPPRRALVGLGAVVAVLTAGLLVSPNAVVAQLASIATDPVMFGLVVAGCYLVRPFLAWPTTPLAAVVGYGFGVTAGVPIATAGVLVTVVPPFVVVRWASRTSGGTSASAGPFAGTIARAHRYVDRYYEAVGPTRGVVVSRLVPIPSDVATAGAAIRGVSLPRFLLGTAVGELPWTVAAVTVGASAATLTGTELRSVDPTLLAGGLLAAGFLLAGPVYRTLADRQPSTTQ